VSKLLYLIAPIYILYKFALAFFEIFYSRMLMFYAGMLFVLVMFVFRLEVFPIVFTSFVLGWFFANFHDAWKRRKRSGSR